MNLGSSFWNPAALGNLVISWNLRSSHLTALRMWNLVSIQWLVAENMVEWYHKITDFEVLPRYIPLGRDVNTDPGLEPMGANKNQLPQDLNVTFFFDYLKGVIFFTLHFIFN